MRTRLVVAAGLLCAATIPIIAQSAGTVSALGKLSPNEQRCFSVNGSTGDGAIVNLTPVAPEAAGDGKLVSSDAGSGGTGSNVNYRVGAVDPNVAITPIGSNGNVCFVNSFHTRVHLVADHLGTIGGAAFTPAKAGGESDRRIDTRQIGGKIPASGTRCFTVSGNPGDAAIVNLTPVGPDVPGDGQLISSDISTPPTASNVNFSPGMVDPNVAIATIGSDGQVCFVNSRHGSVHLVADHLGTIAADSYTPATASGAPKRQVDSRKGGGMVEPSARRCFSVAGDPGDAAIVNLTPVQAGAAGDGQLVSSDVANPPTASNVNFGPGTVDPNVAIATIGIDGKVCFVNSWHTSVHLIADHLGTVDGDSYTPAKANGAPDRRVDTRTETPPTTTTTTTTPPVTTTTVPAGNCHPSYPTVCIPPPPPDLNCGDLPALGITSPFTVVGSDPHRFDQNNDGVGCESL